MESTDRLYSSTNLTDQDYELKICLKQVNSKISLHILAQTLIGQDSNLGEMTSLEPSRYSTLALTHVQCE